MLPPHIARHGSRVSTRSSSLTLRTRAFSQRSLREVGQPRSTLSQIWIPTGSVSATHDESGHGKLIRGGFLRQSNPGIFQLLPLGLRVQQKIENLVDKHMRSLGASRVSLSSITTEALWKKSDRLDRVAPELFRFKDRKDTALMLSPTHEEEITTLVASLVQSYKDLPLRLFQLTRKYRDEMRPRHGLLRSREFLMKDLYTFDTTVESAIDTYKDVSSAYRAFFADLKLPILVAEASSGDMGGDLSHEYHLANPIGEDTVATCSSCGYTANDEVANSRPTPLSDPQSAEFHVWRGISKDRKTLVNAWYPRSDGLPSGKGLNIHAVKAVLPELDASISDPLNIWESVLQMAAKDSSAKPLLLNIVDSRLVSTFSDLQDELPMVPVELETPGLEKSTVTQTSKGADINLLQITDGDSCPRCATGTLQIQRALELGHTFHLGTRYSQPLDASVTLPEAPNKKVPIQMGCHGIGVSRILGSLAEHLSDDRGLKWPRAIAPFEIAIIPTASAVTPEILQLHDQLAGHHGPGPVFDVVLDDRKENFGWKMRDADLTGYPVVVVLGRAWKDKRICEIQCRSLGLKTEVSADLLPRMLEDLMEKL